MRTDTSTIAWRSLVHKAESKYCKSMERMCCEIVFEKGNAHDGRWSSICRGATLWGLEHSKLTTTINDNPTITSRLSRYSYGIPMSEVYDSSKHIIQDRYFHKIKGIYMARNQMKWLLQRVRHPTPVVPHQTEIRKG